MGFRQPYLLSPQAESEVASINMIYGGAGAGKRVLIPSCIKATPGDEELGDVGAADHFFVCRQRQRQGRLKRLEAIADKLEKKGIGGAYDGALALAMPPVWSWSGNASSVQPF